MRDEGLALGSLADRGLDDGTDLETERLGEVEVALVVRGHGHDRAGAVLHQHVVGDEHRDLLAVDRVGDGAAEGNAGLLAVLVAALLAGSAQRLLDVGADLGFVLAVGGEAVELGVLGREHEEGRAEERVGAGREDREVEVELVASEDDLGALGAADPVALHRDHVLGPALEQLEVVEQAVGVVGDPEEPLLEIAGDDLGAAALAAAVDHLLVGEHGRVLGAPLDSGLGPVGEAALEELQEDPLGPAVVLGLVGGELARPVDRDPPGAELLAEGLDRPPGRDAGRLAGLDRVVLGGQAEGVVAHRVDHLEAVAAAEVGDRVADRVALEVADVGLTRGVGQHLEHVGLRLGGVEAGIAGIRHLPGLLLGPDGLPARLDLFRVVSLAHGGAV